MRFTPSGTFFVPDRCTLISGRGVEVRHFCRVGRRVAANRIFGVLLRSSVGWFCGCCGLEFKYLAWLTIARRWVDI